MNENKNQKIMKVVLSLMISFLIIFIVAMFARAASNTILPENSAVSVFINDYLDMMSQKIDKIAVKLKIKRNSVSQYQVNLITQSISDYVGYSMYQTADVLKNYNPNKSASKSQLEKYKNDYYKMTVENPYLRGMTVFDTDGKMLLNLYLSRNKSWPLELQNTLINEIKNKGSLVLNATNENSFYIMEYIKNEHGEMIVSTRNDYSYVSDIAMYYQVADKRLYISDSRNSVYNVREAVGDNNIEKVSSVINRYAYYKKQPSFIVNDSLSVSMIGKEYPNYFELIVLAITALLILICQLIIKGIAAFFKYIMQVKSDKDYVESLNSGESDVDENIVNAQLPSSNKYEEMPPMIQKVHYKIPDKYLKEKENKENNDESKDQKFNIGKDIINLFSSIKEEITLGKSKISVTKEELNKEKTDDNHKKDAEKVKDNIKNNINNIIKDNVTKDNTKDNASIEKNSISNALKENEKTNINNDLNNSDAISIDVNKNVNKIEKENSISNILEEAEKEIDDESNKNNIINEKTITEYENKENQYEESYDKNILNDLSDEEDKYIDDAFASINKELQEEANSAIENIESTFRQYYNNVNNTDNIIDEDYINDESLNIKNESHNNKLESLNKNFDDESLDFKKIDNEEFFNKKVLDSNKNNNSKNISEDILKPYDKVKENISLKKENNDKLENSKNNKVSDKNENKISNSRTNDVFDAFDKMLSSIISKAEEDAKKNITKK